MLTKMSADRDRSRPIATAMATDRARCRPGCLPTAPDVCRSRPIAADVDRYVCRSRQLCLSGAFETSRSLLRSLLISAARPPDLPAPGPASHRRTGPWPLLPAGGRRAAAPAARPGSPEGCMGRQARGWSEPSQWPPLARMPTPSCPRLARGRPGRRRRPARRPAPREGQPADCAPLHTARTARDCTARAGHRCRPERQAWKLPRRMRPISRILKTPPEPASLRPGGDPWPMIISTRLPEKSDS